MNSYSIKAYAKINLGLDVLGKYDNGYHQVKMVMQTVGIHDVLDFERIPEGIELTCNKGDLPLDENNLVYKACKLMFEKYNIKEGLKIHLTKTIPVAAGMAGGSTDAAAVLKAVSRIFDLNCSMEELMELGVKIGADVPYCVMGGTALAEGIGEKLTALEPAPSCFVLVAKPNADVSTGHVYKKYDELTDVIHPDIDGMVDAINAGRLEKILERLGNVLEYVTIPELPVIDTIKTEMKSLGAVNSLMSGSGPTVFGIFTSQAECEAAYEVMKREDIVKDIFVTEFY